MCLYLLWYTWYWNELCYLIRLTWTENENIEMLSMRTISIWPFPRCSLLWNLSFFLTFRITLFISIMQRSPYLWITQFIVFFLLFYHNLKDVSICVLNCKHLMKKRRLLSTVHLKKIIKSVKKAWPYS